MEHNPVATGTMTNEALEALYVLARPTQPLRQPKLVPHPLLDALHRAGTSHIYADTANVNELDDLLSVDDRSIYAGVDGNTANQPLVHKVLEDYLELFEPDACAQHFGFSRRNQATPEQAARCYAVLCAKIGNDFEHLFASGRPWEVSLQVHMGLTELPRHVMEIGRCIRHLVPSAIVKIPFAPHAPECFIVSRDLENENIPVNFTSTFSARQVVAAALLCNVTRTNIFMGRIDQGLQACLLGAHVDLEAQRALRRLRKDVGVKTQLIVASIRHWESLKYTAGCDVYTAPVSVLRDWMTQDQIRPEEVTSRLEDSYADRLGVSAEALPRVGEERIARLYRVERPFIEFLTEYRSTKEWQTLTDGDALYKRFEEAGFGDCFYSPSREDWTEIRRAKVPDLDAPLTQKIPLDTLYSLMADADFEKHQREMDDRISSHLSR